MAVIKKGTKSEDFIPFRFSPTGSQSRRFDSPPLRSFTDSAFGCCVDAQAHRYLNLYLPGSLSLQLFSDAWLRPPASVSRLTLQRVRTVSACLSERVRRLVWHTLGTLRLLGLANFAARWSLLACDPDPGQSEPSFKRNALSRSRVIYLTLFTSDV